MSGYRRVSFYKLCRLCTTNEGVIMPILHGEGRKRQINYKLQICLRIQVSESDFLPKYICEPCLERLEGFFDFRTNCVSAEVMLQSFADTLQDNNDFKRDGTVYVKDSFELPSLLALQNSELCLMSVKNDNNKQQDDDSVQMVEEAEILGCDEDPLMMQDKIITEELPMADKEDVESNNSEDLIEEEGMKVGKMMVKNKENQMAQSESCSSDSTDPGMLNSIIDFVCSVCLKSFKRKEHLNQHIKSHSVERPFKCKSCERSFNRKEHLMRHELCHTGQKEYVCDICLKTFSRKDNVRKHKRTHQPSGPYTCEYCGREFVVKPYYLVHKNTHINNGDPPLDLHHQCYLCNKQFPKKEILTKHLKKHKKEEWIETEDFPDDLLKPVSSGSKSILEQALRQTC